MAGRLFIRRLEIHTRALLALRPRRLDIGGQAGFPRASGALLTRGSRSVPAVRARR
jgi:hypothetical protein